MIVSLVYAELCGRELEGDFVLEGSVRVGQGHPDVGPADVDDLRLLQYDAAGLLQQAKDEPPGDLDLAAQDGDVRFLEADGKRHGGDDRTVDQRQQLYRTSGQGHIVWQVVVDVEVALEHSVVTRCS